MITISENVLILGMFLYQVFQDPRIKPENSPYLTDYCREEFAKFRTFLTSKKCRNWSILLVKKVVLVVFYDRNSSAVIGYSIYVYDSSINA